MKIPKRLIITKQVYDQIKNARMEHLDDVYRADDTIEHVCQARLFLLGANKKGTIVKAEALKPDIDCYESEGCEFMPGISPGVMSRAYVRLTREKLQVIGFAHKLHEGMVKRLNVVMWDHILGDLNYNYPGLALIRFHPEPRAIKFGKKGLIKWIPLTVLNR